MSTLASAHREAPPLAVQHPGHFLQSNVFSVTPFSTVGWRQCIGETGAREKEFFSAVNSFGSGTDSIMHRDCPLDCKVYVGNLGNNGNKTELERAFGYYGPLRSVWVARNPPGFAFVEFEDPRDATDAVRELDGRTLCGCRVRVELSNGEKRSRSRGAPPSWSRRPRERDDYRRRSSPPPRRRSPRRRSFSRSRSRSFSKDRRRERSLSRDRNHKPSRSFSRSRSRSRSNDRK
ncbi:serine/arginine-rich splicing factor 3 isoform X1 [Oryzias latipes]|uniref:Serine/arginine-rich splicing factor 3 n=1 Tax=Oryzias latipes TaxID=8090 RepID=A0A3B3HFQ0_ORYLA|nr:serine/arginine-rich splicing factor 3 isoform X1 [Oryzias latipes]